MSKLVFRLNGVEEDEANEVRQALADAGIDYYETHAGRWRISLAAIWIKNNEDYDAARAAIEVSQQERINQARLEPVPSFWQQSKERPASLLLALIAIGFMLTLMILPFTAWILPVLADR